VAKTLDILVLGASGMLGSAVRRVLESHAGWTVTGTQNEYPNAPDYLDVLEMAPERWLARHYDYIINCIGILKPAVDENDSASLTRAIRINSLFPHAIAEFARRSHIIHLSTDGVFAGTFAGTMDRPYLESDIPDGSDAYARTKALGECPTFNVVNIRCSIIGRDAQFGKGLVEWVLRSREGEELTGYEDHLWNGVTTRQFGELCQSLIESDEFDRIRQVSGIHHFCPNPAITKYDLLCAIRDAAGRNVVIRRGNSGTPTTRILGTVYSQLRALYSAPYPRGARTWDSILKDALAQTTH
jgi:dTDP-4-dehydrorhamnose reductase